MPAILQAHKSDETTKGLWFGSVPSHHDLRASFAFEGEVTFTVGRYRDGDGIRVQGTTDSGNLFAMVCQTRYWEVRWLIGRGVEHASDIMDGLALMPMTFRQEPRTFTVTLPERVEFGESETSDLYRWMIARLNEWAKQQGASISDGWIRLPEEERA